MAKQSGHVLRKLNCAAAFVRKKCCEKRAWPWREAARQYERLISRQAACDDALRRNPQPLRHRVATAL